MDIAKIKKRQKKNVPITINILNGETVVINETSQDVKTVNDVTIKKILTPEKGKGLIIKIDGVLSLPKLSA